MMFAKLLARDIRLGFVRLLPYYIGAVLLGAVLGFGAVALSKVAIGDAAAFTLGDIVAETFDHPVPIDWWRVMQGRPVSLSFEWVLPFALFFACTLDYPRQDTFGVGAKSIALSGSRWSWWLAKSAWCVASSLLFWALFFFWIAFVAFMAGSNMTLEVTVEGLNVIRSDGSSILAADQELGAGANVGLFIISIVGVTCCLQLVQFSISMLVERIPAYAVVMSYLLLSCMFQHVLLLGNYLITGRHKGLFLEGVPLNVGLSECLVVAWLAVTIGGISFSRQLLSGGGRNE